MMRFIVAVLAVLFLGTALLTGLDVMTIEARTGATVFQQIVARVTFGISTLCFVIAIGFSAVLASASSTRSRIEMAIKDIAQSNADSANALKALLAVAEQPARTADAAAAEEKRAKLAAYRAELQEKTPGGRLAIEAAMLADREASKGAV